MSAHARERSAPTADRSAGAINVTSSTPQGTTPFGGLTDPQAVAGAILAHFGAVVAESIVCELRSLLDYRANGRRTVRSWRIPAECQEANRRGIAQAREVLAAAEVDHA